MKRWLPIAILLTSVLYIFGFVPEQQPFKVIFKLIPMFLILYSAYSSLPVQKTRTQWLLLSGLFFGMLGDFLIMFWFTFGLGAFLIGHLLYISGFIRHWRSSWLRLATVLPIAVYSIVMGSQLLSSLNEQGDSALGLPVLFYVIVISVMGWSAIMTRNPLAILGSLLFLVSDSILSWDLFVSEIPYSGVWIMTTYYGAQYLIANSMPTLESRDSKQTHQVVV